MYSMQQTRYYCTKKRIRILRALIKKEIQVWIRKIVFATNLQYACDEEYM